MKTKKLDDWKQTEQVNQKDRAEQEIWEESQRKNAAKDAEANTYQVWKDGKLELESHHESEAIRMAKGIEGKVIWCLEGCGIAQIYPVPEQKINS